MATEYRLSFTAEEVDNRLKEIDNLAKKSEVPSKTSDLTNDSGFITDYTETDPTVPDWAKQPNKPTYIASEVGALPSTTVIPTKTSQLTNDSKFLTSVPSEYVTESELTAKNYALKSEIPSVPVQSVNNKTGAVSLTASDVNAVPTTRTVNNKALSANISLTASDVGALPSTTTIPTKLSELTADSTHRVVTDNEKSTWNAKANTSDIPTKVSQLTNDNNYLTSYTETDPTVPSWAKASSKPIYTASEVGADASGTASSAVSSHNSNTSAHADIREQISQLSSEKANKSDLTSYVKSVNGELPDGNGDVKVTAKAEQPNFVESVEEMTDTTKAYVLTSTGEIWTYQSYQTEASRTPNFTNLYNKNDVVVNTAYVTVNAAASASDGYYKMGLISYDFSNYDTANPVTVRIKGSFDKIHTYSRLVYFRSSDLSAEKFRAYQNFNAHIGYTTESDGTISFPLVIKKDGSTVHGEYMMFRAFSFSNWVSNSAITIDNVPDDLIITINEPITYTEVPPQTIYEWRSTGMMYNSSDYEPRIIALENDVKRLDTRVSNLEASGGGGGAVSVRNTHQDNAVLTVTKLNNSTTFSENGITFVGDELWVMKDDSTYTNGTRIFRYHVDGDTFTYLGYIDGDFGHLNTMDYCEANDCFIFGNGGNDTSTEGNFFVVIKNPLSLGYAETVTIAELVARGQAIKYDLDSTIGSIGFKVQALWGDSNLGDNNIVVLIASNTETIKHVLLTKTNGEFDGGLIVLRSFTSMAAFGVQDSDIWGDTLYIGGQGTVGNPGRYLICEVSLTDPTQRKIIARDFYQEDGTALTGCVQGIYVDHDYVWVATNAASTSGKAVALTKYRR